MATIIFLLVLPQYEGKIVFFIVQEARSFLLLFSVLFVLPQVVILFSLLLKIAVPPFHSWVMVIIQRLRGFSFVFFLTLLKILPFFLACSFVSFVLFPLVVFFLFLNNVWIIRTTKVKELFLFSSGLNFFWFLFCFFLFLKVFFLYLFLYLFLITKILFLQEQKYFWGNLGIFIFLFGAPPFFIFFIKWVIIATSSTILYVFAVIMLLLVIRTFSYFRIMYSLFLSKRRNEQRTVFYFSWAGCAKVVM